LITFGHTAAQLQRQGGGISPIDALALLPTGTVTAPIAKLIGVNRMEIEAVQSPTTGSAGGIQPRLTLGKDLTDRLRASVSTAFGVSTEQMAQLEYRVTPRISLLGSWEGQTRVTMRAEGTPDPLTRLEEPMIQPISSFRQSLSRNPSCPAAHPWMPPGGLRT
jgi:hypothetical protein